jgi:chitin disaccharide deacetylase
LHFETHQRVFMFSGHDAAYDTMILCADDYGLSDGVNEAILELCALGRLSAVSCMVALERCDAEAMDRVLALKSKVDVGLHLCLTDERLTLSACPMWPGGRPPQLPSFRKLLSRSLLGMNRQGIAESIATQYKLFQQKSGARPDFIDGHLHIHQLPGVAGALEAFVLSLPAESRPYVRNTHLPLSELRSRHLPWVKAAFIGGFGRRMRHRLGRAGIRTNRGFAGVYNFKRFAEFPAFLPRFVECLPHANGMLVAHPGRGEPWRERELASLREFPFPRGTIHRFQP